MTTGSGLFEIDGVTLAIGDVSRHGTLMAVLDDGAIFEDFRVIDGDLVYLTASSRRTFPKTAEATSADSATLFACHSLDQVLNSDGDLLGSGILAQDGDPSFEAVASLIAPITTMAAHTFVGSPYCADKVGFAYGGRTPNFDPATFLKEIITVRQEKRVLDGLVGGWLPVVRFVYPLGENRWAEFCAFAPLSHESANPRVQPVWYRVLLVEQGNLSWVRYFDTYPPFPPRLEAPAADYYRALLKLQEDWEALLAPAMKVDIPDAKLANQALHSLVRTMMTRVDDFPKYGAVDRNYGGAEHDGFPDTLNSEASAMLDWGLFDRARAILDNYFSHFIRDDGSIDYRGPEVGQYGRMLTVFANYVRVAGDTALLQRHRDKIQAVARLLMSLRRSGDGLLWGWCEADSCLEPEPARYMLPYLANSAEAIRGLRALAQVDDEQAERYAEWASELSEALDMAVVRSELKNTDPPCIPAIADAGEPFDVASRRDSLDPQFRAYRAYSEMLHSGVLDRTAVQKIVDYRAMHRDILLGVPAAYGYNSGEMGGFLSYGHAYGLLQHDMVREYVLLLYSLSAHHYTRGLWTAPETRRLDPEATAAPYCVPAQLCVPMLLRWMLVWEDPDEDVLWLAKAVPREWLASGRHIEVSDAPTRWGRVSFRIEVRDNVQIYLRLPPIPRVRLRLRLPLGTAIRLAPDYLVLVDAETLEFPSSSAESTFSVEVER